MDIVFLIAATSLGVLASGLIGALLVRIATKWVTGVDVPFGRAFILFFVIVFANFVVVLTLGVIAVFVGGEEALAAAQILSLPNLLPR